MGTVKGFYLQSKVCSVFVEADNVAVKKTTLVKDSLALNEKFKKESCSIEEFPIPYLIELFKKYLDGKVVSFDYDCDLTNYTSLERAILSIVKNIPYSKTMSYEDVAKEVGNKNLSRMVGRTVAKNPTPIIIPCHRVIGKNGVLTGFTADGGIALKKDLLEMEAKIMKQSSKF